LQELIGRLLVIPAVLLVRLLKALEVLVNS